MKAKSLLKLFFLLFLIVVFVGCSANKEAYIPPGTPVLIITLDAARADRLGCYGSKSGLTPVLDSFSKEATPTLQPGRERSVVIGCPELDLTHPVRLDYKDTGHEFSMTL